MQGILSSVLFLRQHSACLLHWIIFRELAAGKNYTANVHIFLKFEYIRLQTVFISVLTHTEFMYRHFLLEMQETTWVHIQFLLTVVIAIATNLDLFKCLHITVLFGVNLIWM